MQAVQLYVFIKEIVKIIRFVGRLMEHFREGQNDKIMENFDETVNKS